jgi:hypothetical protein
LASKYKCPACGFRSCSLPCVRAHKLKTSCSGKRDRTSFLPISAFDDARLLSGQNTHVACSHCPDSEFLPSRCFAWF